MLAQVPAAIVSVMFHQSVEDLCGEVMRLSALPQTGLIARLLLGRVVAMPRTSRAELDFVAKRFYV